MSTRQVLADFSQGEEWEEKQQAPKVKGVWGSAAWTPKINVMDKGHSYAVDLALPGIRAGASPPPVPLLVTVQMCSEPL